MNICHRHILPERWYIKQEPRGNSLALIGILKNFFAREASLNSQSGFLFIRFNGIAFNGRRLFHSLAPPQNQH